MPITLEQHQSWQSNPDSERVILVVARAYDIENSTEKTLYLSSVPFQSSPTDTPANIGFEPRLMGDFTISYSIPFLGESRGDSGLGSLQINNGDGALDEWLYYAWDGRSISVYWGDPSWSFDDFAVAPLLLGIAERIENTNDNTIELFFADIVGQLNREVQSTLIADGPNKDKPVPICYGLVWNISPVLIDPNIEGGLYQVHDGAINAFDAVYDNGVLLVSGIDYTPDTANGTITMSVRPVGTITADVQGGKYGGSWVSKTCEIAKALIVDVFGEVEGYLDLAAFAAIDAAKSYGVGVYITDRANLLDILDELFASVGAGYFWDGIKAKLTAVLLQNPSVATPDYYWTGVNVARDGLTFEIAKKPQYRTRLSYGRNYTVQSADSLAASITDPSFGDADFVAFVGKEWSEVVYESAATASIYPTATDPALYDTLITEYGDALQEAQARQAILGSQVIYLSVSDISGALAIMPGDFLNVSDDDFGLSTGRTIQVLSVEKSVLDSRVDVRGWFLGTNIFCIDYQAIAADYSLDLGLYPCVTALNSEDMLSTIL